MSKIFIYDEFNPEDTAMMQALYSRSAESVTKHAQKVKETGSGKFMEKFYVGYGHSSIADCGSTTIFIEQISILADKAIQDWPLYCGQETSTRYVNMAKQPIIDPLNSPESKKILKEWMKFYVENQEEVKNHIKKNYPKKDEENEAIYEKAVVARCFDIMRGFLPAGITTQLSWHTNLRQAWDKLALMQYNPLPEVKEISKKIIAELKEKYPNSFCHKIYNEQEEYRSLANEKYNFYNPSNPPLEFSCSADIREEELNKHEELISRRPIKTNLPHFLTELGLISFEFMLDFGSFRDIQRHRNGVCRLPLHTIKYGYNDWYLDELPDNIKQKAKKLIEEQKERIADLNADEEIKQYYISLGFNMPCKITYGLPAAVYVTELRSGKLVHPTLRKIARQMDGAMRKKFPKLLLHSDLEKSDWDVRRGQQDIVKKNYEQ